MENKIESFRNKVFKKRINIMDEKIINKMMIEEYYNQDDCIPKIFNDLNYSLIKKFEIYPFNIILENAKKNIIVKKITKKNVIVIIHPFYPILRHINLFYKESNADFVTKYVSYQKKILKLLKNKSLNIILVDSPDSFIRYTSKFNKNGGVKNVIFSEHSNGNLLSNSDKKIINKFKQVRICGCYRNLCIDDFKKNFPGIDFIDLNELMLDRPNNI